MKRTSSLIAVCLLSLSYSTLFAMHHPSQPSSPFLVTLPDTGPGYAFNITLLALRPGATNLNYIILNKELPAQSPSWTEREVRPSYGFAFELAASYLFPEGKDVTLDWTHLNTSTSASTNAPNSSFFLGPDYQIGPPGTTTRHSTGASQFKYDVANLSGGQLVNFGRYLQMRFFGGLSAGFLREQVNSNFSGTITTPPFVGPFSTRQQVTANFSGLGPRFGMGGNVDLTHGFSLLGEGAVSGLVGTSYAKTTFTSSAVQLLDTFGNTINNQFIKDQNVIQVIPGFDAKIGVGYQHDIRKGLTFMVKGGYEAAVYVNAINQYLPGSLVNDAPASTGGIFVATVNHTLSNYSVQGPFLDFALAIT